MRRLTNQLIGICGIYVSIYRTIASTGDVRIAIRYVNSYMEQVCKYCKQINNNKCYFHTSFGQNKNVGNWGRTEPSQCLHSHIKLGLFGSMELELISGQLT